MIFFADVLDITREPFPRDQKSARDSIISTDNTPLGFFSLVCLQKAPPAKHHTTTPHTLSHNTMEPPPRHIDGDGDVNVDVDVEKGVRSDESIRQHTPPTIPDDQKLEKKKGTPRDPGLDSASDTDTETDDETPGPHPPNTTETHTPVNPLTTILSRILSRPPSHASQPPSPPPDGGLPAWLAVFCAHLVVMNTWGFINTFGVFQTYYASSLSRPPADISWIGSFQVFLLFFVGALTGRLTDAGYFRPVLAFGSALQVLGIFSSSFAGGSYWQLFLAQGVCMGLGNGFLFCPTMAVVATYFERRRAVAIGIVACGTGTGGLVFPGMVRELMGRVGFAWTMRAVGAVQVVTLGVANGWLRPRRGLMVRGKGMGGEWLDLGALREVEYLLYMGGSFMVSFLGGWGRGRGGANADRCFSGCTLGTTTSRPFPAPSSTRATRTASTCSSSSTASASPGGWSPTRSPTASAR